MTTETPPCSCIPRRTGSSPRETGRLPQAAPAGLHALPTKGQQTGVLRGGPSLSYTPGFPPFYTQTQLQGSVGLPITNQHPHLITHTTPQPTPWKGLLKHLLTERTAQRIAPPLTPHPKHTHVCYPASGGFNSCLYTTPHSERRGQV